jgi:flagellar basal body-associated protein FliL
MTVIMKNVINNERDKQKLTISFVLLSLLPLLRCYCSVRMFESNIEHQNQNKKHRTRAEHGEAREPITHLIDKITTNTMQTDKLP